MRELEELQEKIENERMKLDRMMEKASETDCFDEDACYKLSVKLDVLIEEYIELQNALHLSV